MRHRARILNCMASNKPQQQATTSTIDGVQKYTNNKKMPISMANKNIEDT